MSLKFESGCTKCCPDAVLFSNVVYCDHFDAVYVLFFFAKYF